MVSLGPGRWEAGVAVSVCIRNQCDNALLAVPLWLGLYHENRSLHLGGRSDCKENRPQLHANTRRFNHLSACICVHLWSKNLALPGTNVWAAAQRRHFLPLRCGHSRGPTLWLILAVGDRKCTASSEARSAGTSNPPGHPPGESVVTITQLED